MKSRLTLVCIALVTGLFASARAAEEILAPKVRFQEVRTVPGTSGVKGGFVVHLGCGDGKLTAELKKSDAYIVHGLDADPARVREARERFLAGGFNGTVSAAAFDGEHLPYIDNMVNLLVLSSRFNV